MILPIETTVNKALIVCQKILTVVGDPSEKILWYVFETIQEQLFTKERKEKENIILSQKKVRELTENIRQQEELEKEDIDKILEGL